MRFYGIDRERCEGGNISGWEAGRQGFEMNPDSPPTLQGELSEEKDAVVDSLLDKVCLVGLEGGRHDGGDGDDGFWEDEIENIMRKCF